MSTFLKVNVGGKSFVLLAATAGSIPKSVLGQLSSSSHQERLGLCDGFIEETDEYYFERSAAMFRCIISAYRKGQIHVPTDVCRNDITEELQWWGVNESFIAPCCRTKNASLPKLEVSDQSASKLSALSIEPPGMEVRQGSGESCGYVVMDPLIAEEESVRPVANTRTFACYSNWRNKIWQGLENPTSSVTAIVFMSLTMVFIMITVVVMILGSIKQFQTTNTNTNETAVVEVLEHIDTACVTWFTFDYIVRLWSSPNRCLFVREPMSIVDLLSALPFYLELIFGFLGYHHPALEGLRRSLLVVRVLRILRVLRVLRILKVARYSKGFQSMAFTLRKSWRELILLLMFMITTNIIFSTAIYFVEQDNEKTMFTSIPQAAWWCTITMTTVGYGDVYPITVGGKVIGCLASISGIILLAFPISVIVENFNQEYVPKGEAKKDLLSDEGASPMALAEFAKNAKLDVQFIDGKWYLEFPTHSEVKKYRRKTHFY